VAGFYLQNGEREPLTVSPVNTELTDEDQYRLELETFGYPLSIHPLERYRPILSRRIKYAQDIPLFVGQSIYLIGVYITRKETVTGNSEPMEFLTLEDVMNAYYFRKYFRNSVICSIGRLYSSSAEWLKNLLEFIP